MSENDDTPTPPADPPADPETPPADPPANDDPNDNPDDASEIGKVRREAATYRTRLRDAEGERDKLAGVLDEYHRREAERLVGDRLATPSDLWLEIGKPDSILGEDGAVDPELVDSAVDAVLEKHPGWGPRPQAPLPRRQPTERLKGGRNPEEPAAPSWADVMRSQ